MYSPPYIIKTVFGGSVCLLGDGTKGERGVKRERERKPGMKEDKLNIGVKIFIVVK